MCLWYFRIWKWGFDAYILKYEPDTTLDWHTDPVENGKHWRLNISLKGFSFFFTRNKQGIADASRMWNTFIRFRPDIEEHCVHISSTGATKLSLGFVKFD